ncbi:hypothetical protein CPT_MarsHill_028 [Staphylococcus phage MarsHill]|nr:hypothetical protein CPT_MarsHill_028 [Staphylococcus phage MarsHill]
MRKTVNPFDWHIFKKGKNAIIPFRCLIALFIFSIIMLYLSIIYSVNLFLLSLIIFIPILIISTFIYVKYFNDEIMAEYKFINFSYEIKGNYYSKWFFNMVGVIENEKELHELNKIIFNISKFHVRELDRYNWKNNTGKNRLLTYREFIKYRKNILKLEENIKIDKYIKEFQEYHKLKIDGGVYNEK